MRFTPEMIEILKTYYPSEGSSGVIKRIYSISGHTYNPLSIRDKAKKLKIKGFNPSHFSKGHRPKHTGKNIKITPYERKKTPEGTIVTRSKKGIITLFIKLNGIYTPYARHIYISHYGEYPKNQIIHYLNGDRTDVRIENLALEPRTRKMNASLTQEHFMQRGLTRRINRTGLVDFILNGNIP